MSSSSSDESPGSPQSAASSNNNETAAPQNIDLSDDSDSGSNKSESNADVKQKPMASVDDDSDSVKSDIEEPKEQGLVLSDSEHEEPPEPEIIVDKIPSDRLQFGELGPVFVRLPNFLSIEPKPFDERTYDPEMDDDDVVDMEGRSRMKLKIENTIRWRNVRDPETDEVKKESNAKVVRWSDGSLSLHLGSEIFEIQDQKAIPNQHLFTRIGASLQAQSAFERKFTFRPHSTDTLTHRKMTMNMADKSNRIQKVKMVTAVGMNPEKARTENIKKEEEKLRALNRKQTTQRRARERVRDNGLTSGFLEGGDGSDEEENVGAMKRHYGDYSRMNTYGAGAYSDESDGEEERAKTIMNTRVIASSDEEDNSQGDARTSNEPRSKTRIIEDD